MAVEDININTQNIGTFDILKRKLFVIFQAMVNRISDNESRLDSLEESTEYQVKTRDSNVTVGGIVSEYGFNNVEPGRYRLTVNIRIETRGSDDASVAFDGPNGNIMQNIGQLNSYVDADFKAINHSASKIFELTSGGNIECNFIRNGGTGQIFHTGSFVMLESLKNVVSTTKWT